MLWKRKIWFIFRCCPSSRIFLTAVCNINIVTTSPKMLDIIVRFQVSKIKCHENSSSGAVLVHAVGRHDEAYRRYSLICKLA